MNSNPKLSCAIAAILSGSPIGLSYAAPTTDTSDVGEIQEITVTAQRRTENIQNVPITIDALTSETLTQLNVETFDDFLRYLPNVISPTNGPGQGEISMRGLSSGSAGTQGGGSFLPFPNVAVYLDDQSGQLPGRNLDVYAVDMERIEVLEGPQGTLFGAGAEAGVIRYITNKPKLNVTEGSVTAGYGTTAGGADNSSVEAMINLPLIPDTLAVRAVIYNDDRGGYINNVPGTFTRKNTDLGISYAGYPAVNGQCPDGKPNNGSCVPPGSQVINNNASVQNAINPVTYQGIRASMLYQINDDWSALLTQTYQTMDAQGVFYQMPYSSDGQALAPLSVTLFNPSDDRDRFENTAWTVNGKFGDLKAVYTGGYLVRNISQVQDYTNYARGQYADYYQCAPAHNGVAATCYSPATFWQEQERNTHQSHELRLSTPDDWRLRGIIGAFWEDEKLFDQTDWDYKTLPGCTATVTTGCETDVGPAPGATLNNPAPIRSDSTAFFNDIQRGYKQYAFFASSDVDLIPKVLTFTAGTRYYDFKNTEVGTLVGSGGCFDAGAAPCLASAKNIDGENLKSTYSGFKSRVDLSWHITPDALLYYTWSQGFRPGGFNRTSGLSVPPTASCKVVGAGGVPQYCVPQGYESDSLTNNELGWKTEFLDHHFQWNGALYQENWDNAQVQFFDPGETGNLGFETNGQNFRIRGVETSIVARITHGLTAQGSAAWNSSVQTNSPYLVANNPALLTGANATAATIAEYGKPITTLANPYGPAGEASANSPPIQFNLRLRYEWTFNNYNAFAQVGGTHTGHSFTQASTNAALAPGGAINSTLFRFENPAYSTYDASIGVAKDAWNVQAFGQNLSNSNASVFTSTSQFDVAETVIRPRVLGVKFGYKF